MHTSKGTLYIRKFLNGAPVTPTEHCKKHGHVYLLSARVLDAKTALGFYGRMR